MSTIKGLLGLAIAGVVVGLIIMYSGIIDVGATNRHHPLTQYVLSTAMENSVRHHAKGIKIPPLDDPKMVLEGFRDYRDMCVGCHLAPGVKSSEIRKGLTPEPPKLQESVDEWQPNELFWVIKNGVKMTGMPAWGPTHSDDRIWAMVAFLEKLPLMTVDQYTELKNIAASSEGAGHHHDEEGAGSDNHHDESEHGHDDEAEHSH